MGGTGQSRSPAVAKIPGISHYLGFGVGGVAYKIDFQSGAGAGSNIGRGGSDDWRLVGGGVFDAANGARITLAFPGNTNIDVVEGAVRSLFEIHYLAIRAINGATGRLKEKLAIQSAIGIDI